MANRALIYFPQNDITPRGGPAGYLYNLRVGLQDIGRVDDIDFLPSDHNGIERNARLRKAVPSRVKDLRRLKKMLSLTSKKVEVDSRLARYDLIHFERVEDMYFARDFLKGYDGQVVLTTHCPCAPYQELIGRLNPKDAARKMHELEGLQAIDEYAFSRADRIVFPCREAEEPYFNTWPRYKSIRDQKKIRYLPTGIVPCTAARSRGDVRRQYDIPEDAFVVCFVGRHNEIKGYPDLVGAAQRLLGPADATTGTASCKKEIRFLIAGKEEPLHGLRNKRWTEVGWTTDPHSIIAASDVFVLPNRQTYFDLVMLEVLSLGVPVIASRTGGNKYFQRFERAGIFYFDDSSDLAQRILEVASLPSDELRQFGLLNQELYKKHFSADVFARGYIGLVSQMLDDQSSR